MFILIVSFCVLSSLNIKNENIIIICVFLWENSGGKMSVGRNILDPFSMQSPNQCGTFTFKFLRCIYAVA